jgi:Asparagine synthase (glutamine-hydrolyzing)
VISTAWLNSSAAPAFLDQKPNGIRARLSRTSTQQLYYRAESGSLHLADDLRLLVHPADTLDEKAVYSLLQYGAVVPPMSLWKQIRRAVPGRITEFDGATGNITETEFPSSELWEESTPLALDEQIALVTAALDQVLLEAGKSHRILILFSGGVDSGLLAARAASLGLTDTVLVNYSFGLHDEEAALANRMAAHLGLKFEQIQDVQASDAHAGTDVKETLANAGRLFVAPFCDPSVIPTSRLARSVIRNYGSEFIAFDGTGADGAFGLFRRANQWQKFHSLPGMVAGSAAVAYRALGLSARQSKVEYWSRLLARRSQHPYPLSAVAQNPLAGIAYDAPKQTVREVDELLLSWLSSIAQPDPAVQVAALDLALVCSCMFAQKSAPIFAASPLQITYPYLSPKMTRLAMSSTKWQGADQDAKWLLKAALAKHVPHEMVYRPKSGFVAPMEQKLKSDAFLAAFDRIVAGDSAISPFIKRAFLQNLRPRIAAGVALPPQTTNFVWGVTFTSVWLDQVLAQARAGATSPSAASSQE